MLLSEDEYVTPNEECNAPFGRIFGRKSTVDAKSFLHHRSPWNFNFVCEKFPYLNMVLFTFDGLVRSFRI
jgi:hypothetical protein